MLIKSMLIARRCEADRMAAQVAVDNVPSQVRIPGRIYEGAIRKGDFSGRLMLCVRSRWCGEDGPW